MSKKAKIADLEASLKEINELIEKMEQGDLSLEQSLGHFEQGISLIKNCQKILREAEQKVQILIQNSNPGEGEMAEELQPYTSPRIIMSKDASFQAWIAATSLRLHQCLADRLEGISYPAEGLQNAMAYAVLGDGKRLRPLLVYATGKIFDAPLENLDLAATAVELIHCYSLVHDDLPAMDNAELRRGKLSCFKAFGEDVAILAGDALQTLAFEVMTDFPAPLPAAERLAMIQILSRASGPSGMVSGQALDILNTPNAQFSEKRVLQLYQLKTGALLAASIKLGCLAAMVKNETELDALGIYAENISLAFQIQDDILDIEGQAAEIGKPVGLDQAQNKATYPLVVGLVSAKEKVQLLFQRAFQALEIFGPRAAELVQLTEYLGHRKK